MPDVSSFIVIVSKRISWLIPRLLLVGSFFVVISLVTAALSKFPELAEHLVGLMLHKVVARSPKLRVEIQIPRWMPPVVDAAETLGFEKRVEYLKMGLLF